MPLSPEQQQELAELKRLETLEQKYGNSAQTAEAAPKSSAVQAFLSPLQKAAGSDEMRMEAKRQFGQFAPKPPSEADIQAYGQGIERRRGEMAAEHPTAYGAGQVAADVAPYAMIPGGIPAQMAGSAAISLMQTKGDLPQAAKEAATAGALGAGAKLIGKGVKAVAGKAADRMQQAAMGMKKYTPGAGTTAIEEGVRGSKASQVKKVSKGLDKWGQKLEAETRNIKAPTNPENVAREVEEQAAQFIDQQGNIHPDDLPKVQAIQEQAARIRQDGAVDAVEALTQKRIEGQSGYRGDNPIEQFKGKLRQKTERAWEKEISRAADLSGNKAAWKEANKRTSHLIKAKKALDKPENIKQSLSLSDYLLTGAGIATGGPAGGAAALIGKKLANTPTGLSYGAKAADLSGKLAESAGSGVQQVSPALSSLLVSKKDKK